jgi:hypothetical protein
MSKLKGSTQNKKKIMHISKVFTFPIYFST